MTLLTQRGARIGCAGGVVVAGLRPLAAQVYERSMAGTCGGTPQVDRGHEPCWQVAVRMARHVMARQLPAVFSRRFPLRGDRACQQTVAGLSGQVLRCRSQDRLGIFGGV